MQIFALRNLAADYPIHLIFKHIALSISAYAVAQMALRTFQQFESNLHKNFFLWIFNLDLQGASNASFDFLFRFTRSVLVVDFFTFAWYN
jgi:hypothetical protein